jgi:hypothetical protein
MASQDSNVASGATQGAAAGSVAGPYGSLIGAAGGALAGLLAPTPPTVDISQLLSTINNAGQYQQGLINSLPTNLQALIAPYVQGMTSAGTTLQNQTQQQGQDYLDKVTQLYGPNSPAAQAAMAAFKQQAYSTLPGTLNATKANLAATGGLGRGAAAKGIEAAIQAPATAVSQNAANVTATQTAASQQAQQQALATINQYDNATFQQLFGMSKDMATTIMNSGRQDLQNQLTQLLTQSNNQTNQLLGVEGIAANNGYQNAVTNNAQTANNTANLINLGLQGVGAGYGAINNGVVTAAPTGYTNPSQYNNVSTSGTSFPTALSL